MNTADMNSVFEAATDFVQLKVQEGDALYKNTETMLAFYGMYKQALEGPVQDPQPSILHPSARKKWNAWNSVRNLTREEAREGYIQLVTDISPDWRDHIEAERPKGLGPCVSRIAGCMGIPDNDESESKRILQELIHCDMDEERWQASLQRKGLEANAVDSDGQTALHFAADHGNTEAIDIFIGHGMDVNVPDNGGTTPLHCAAASGHRDAAMQLIAHGARLDVEDDDNDTPLDVAPPEWREDEELLATLQTE